jgi:hypothetical protein
MTTPNADAQSPDTTTGGGENLYPGTPQDQQQPYEAPPDQQGPAANERQTDDLSGGAPVGRTGDTDSHLNDPRTTVADTTIPGGGAGGIGQVGDTDPHTKDPVDYSTRDTTVLGGGVSADSTGQAYRAPSQGAPASELDTSGRSGVLSVNPGSPDAAVVGNTSGVNPNAVEPGLTDSASFVTVRDTTYAGAPTFTPVPAQLGTPSAPTGVTAVLTPNSDAVTVSWTPAGDAATTGVREWQVESNTTGTVRVGKEVNSVDFDEGLIPGQTYTFTVFAVTYNGTGRRSAPSAPVTIPSHRNLAADADQDEGLGRPAGVPATMAAPTAVAGAPGSNLITVNWVAPAASGSPSPIQGYTVTPYLAGVAQAPVAVGNVLTLAYTPSTPGGSYTFTVAATNLVGTGVASPQSSPATIAPANVPAQVAPAPVATAGAAASKQITVTWTAPASNGSPITGYSVVPYVGGVAQAAVPVGNVLTYTYTSAASGDSDYFTVAAVNAVGTGAASANSNTVAAP